MCLDLLCTAVSASPRLRWLLALYPLVSTTVDVQAWGVHVKEVWAMDSELPVTPMGNVDRSAASVFSGGIDVFDVDERHGVLRARVGGHEAKS